MKMKHEFVEFIPDNIEEGILYVSVEYGTVVHKCCCGCGCEVVTPLTPTDWYLTYNGDSISLSPSVGNWEFECQSHYWIRKNRVEWAGQWTKELIEQGREYDKELKEHYYTEEPVTPSEEEPVSKPAPEVVKTEKRWRLFSWLFGLK